MELWRRGVRGLRSGWASKTKQAKHFSLRIDGSLDLERVYSPSANRERDDEKVLLLSGVSRDLDESRATADDRRLDDLAATAQARRNDRERTADDMRSALVASRGEDNRFEEVQVRLVIVLSPPKVRARPSFFASER